MPLDPKDTFTLTRNIWTHDDFDAMGWHDVNIHAVTCNFAEFELVFDIDYIFAWVNPEPPSDYFTFWIAPCTLVFRNVRDLKINLGDPLGLQIMDITRSNPRCPRNAEHIDLKTEWSWNLDMLQGSIDFSSAGYSQFTRRPPVRSRLQRLTPEERGGISFARPTALPTSTS